VPAPSVGDIKVYLGQTSFTDDQIESARAAELGAQSRVVRQPAADAVWDADLAEALKRRVARNLAMRGIPLAMFSGDADGGSLIPPGRDPEVRRLEGPWRKLKSG
jgi:hypothetical protein